MENNLMVAGFGGQGIMLMGKLLSEAACDYTDKNISFFPSYGAQQRGGTANCYVVISDDEVSSPMPAVLDELVVFNAPSYHRFLPNLKKGGLLIINSSLITDEIERDDIKVLKAPVTDIALELGNLKVLNIVMLGAYIGYTNIIDADIMLSAVKKKLAKKPALLELNEKAFNLGLEAGKKCLAAQ